VERSFICLFYDESQNRTQKEKRKVVFLLAVLTRSAWRTPRLRGSPCYCSASPCALTVCTLQKDDPGCHPDPEQIPELLGPKYKAYHETLTPLSHFNLQKINACQPNTGVKPWNLEGGPRAGDHSGLSPCALRPACHRDGNWGTKAGSGRMSPLPCQARKTQSSADVSKGSVQIANHLDYDSREQKSQARALLTRSQLTMRGTSAPQNIPVPKSLSACMR